MFERFTERARKVVVLSQEEARRFDHNYIGTEHLLLGLLRENEGVAFQALKATDVSLAAVREQVESIVGYGEEGMGGQAPFTPRSKKALEFSLEEAVHIGHNYIGTEHILLGLVRHSKGVAAKILYNLDASPDEIRREVIRLLESPPESDTDSLDLVEARMEAEEVAASREEDRAEERILFQSRLNGIKVETFSMGILKVDLDYTYAASVAEGFSGMTDHTELFSCVRRVFADHKLSAVEDGVSEVGVNLLSNYPELRIITVSATRWIKDSGNRDYEATISATFRP